jgi:hypothetical protein
MSRRQATAFSRMQREVRKVEAEAREANPGQDVGTGQTILRLQRHQPPLRTLLDARKIGPDELEAAEQIAQAAASVAMGGILRAVQLERIHGRPDERDWPHTLAVAVRNYQDWQRYWTAEWARTRNPMLEVVWSAVVDEQPIAGIAADIGYGHRRTTRAIICGIRHYAAFAGLVTGVQRQTWLDAAQHVFARTAPDTTS